MRFTLLFALSASVPAVHGAERWVMLEAPRFTVVSQMSETATRDWTDEFEQYIWALGQRVPIDESRLPRLTIVLFAHERDFLPYRPVRERGGAAPVAGFFARRNQWAVVGLASRSDNADTRRVIFHEGAHWYLSAMEGIRPPWLEEGIAEVYSSFATDRLQTRLGDAIPRHMRTLVSDAWIPLDRLVTIGPGDAVVDEQKRLGVFYAESWLLTHYLMFGTGTPGPNTSVDGLAQRTKGIDFDELDRSLRQYILRGTFQLRNESRRPSELRKVPLTPASPFAVQTALARLALGGRQPAQAENFALGAVNADPGNPIGYELLGLARADQDHSDAAAEAYAGAAAHGSTNDRVYFDLGMHKLYGGGPRPRLVLAAANSEADARQAADYFGRAIALEPKLPGSYTGLAAALGFIGKPTEMDRTTLASGHALFPNEGQITLGLAVVAQKLGNKAEAAALVRSVTESPGKYAAVAADYATRLTINWKFEEAAGEVIRLAEAGDIEGALKIIDRDRNEPYSGPQHRVLADFRQNLAVRSRLLEAQTAADASHWADARRALAEIVAMDVPLTMKLDAYVMLKQLDRADPR